MMEKITINNIEKKVAKNGKPFWVVKYNDGKDATIGEWHSQLADYIEKDVGIGGSVKVVITQKGEYTNITEVDMTSAEPLPAGSQIEAMGDLPAPEQEGQKCRSPKEIVACVLTECVVCETNTKEEVLNNYNFFLKEL